MGDHFVNIASAGTTYQERKSTRHIDRAVQQGIEFVGLGAARSGTSWIANVLRAHPEICISEPKEVRFFNRYEMPVGRLRQKKNKNFDNDMDWYLQRFRHAKKGQIRGEFSPVYLADEHAAARLHETLPNAKLIACLRNPVARAFSLYRLHLGNGQIPDISFEEALAREPVYVETGMYGAQLERFLEFYDRSQIHLMIFEELIRDADAEFKRLFSFLGADPDVGIDYGSFHTNHSAKRRSKKLHRAAFRTSQWMIDHGFSSVLTMLRSAGAHTLFNKINGAPPEARRVELTDDIRATLAERFNEDIHAVEKILGREIIVWR